MKALPVRSRAIKKTLIHIQIILFVLFFGNSLAATEMQDISQDDLLKGLQSKSIALLLDVRNFQEFRQAHIAGAVNIPLPELQRRLGEIITFREKKIVIYCRSGRRARIAMAILHNSGFKNLLHLNGDLIGWWQNKRPLVR